MSRAFTKEDDSAGGLADLGERPVSSHRNLVTAEGLAAIAAEVAALRAQLGAAEAAADRARIAMLSRDLRYWNTRRESAELSVPGPDFDVVRFGMTVTVEDDDGRRNAWKIVGEDEADASNGRISHVSPMAVALFGKRIGDLAIVNGKEWAIEDIQSEG